MGKNVYRASQGEETRILMKDTSGSVPGKIVKEEANT